MPPSTARAVVIGGGILGCSVLYHLTRLGWRDVVLLEKGELTQGSTWHAAGNTPHFSTSLAIARLHMESVALYQRLEAETGQAVGFHKTGSLRLALKPERMDEWRHHRGKARYLGLPYELLGPREIAELHPLVETKGILGAVWNPEDGHIDPASVTQALAKGARDGGAKVLRQTEVIGLARERGGEWLVETAEGRIRAETVVNAAGLWAREAGALTGLDLPIVPMEHQYLVTEAIPEIAARARELPILRDVDVSYYLRQERGGLLLGPYERPAKAWGVGRIPAGFGMELLPPELDRLQTIFEQAIARVPALGRAGIKRVVNGAITYTPDGNPMLGPVRGLPNYFLAVGFSFGITQAGGAGKELAEWIVEGEPGHELWEIDPRRYGAYATLAHALERCVDMYEDEYAIAFPALERAAGRPARTSPLQERLAAAGAVFGARNGWERANWFAGPGEEPIDRPSFRRANWFEAVARECRTVRERVGVLDMTSFAKFEASGPGAAAFLDRLVANRLPAKAGGTALLHFLTPKGGITAEMVATRLGAERFYLVSAAAAELHDLDWLERHLPADGSVRVENLTERYGALLVTGPRARELLVPLTGHPLDNARFPWRAARELTLAGVGVRALRISYAGELGWELHLASAELPALYERIMAAGAGLGVAPFGFRALDSLRLEKAYRGWGSELSTEASPLAAGLERFVHLDKGDFVGRAALLAEKARGPRERLVYLAIDEDGAAAGGADAFGGQAVLRDGRTVGIVTSGGYGHTVRRGIAWAYVEPALAAPGTALEIEVLGERRPARVAATALYDPENRRLAG
ncbi:MAG TPA: FAD-dependent oxidoreductase [Alphaproteobacteria bacterium]|nr:FAD-dependent oxidoreductase [Alphaproteobacteria bacterium]